MYGSIGLYVPFSFDFRDNFFAIFFREPPKVPTKK
uniref:Photosystem II protein T n=1 Tax=Urochondra setulosa TaxID=751591 RepID=A0A4D6FYL8_9POAL|nr:photosystem II protein T [Urochondra setulosa]QCB91913.1 photosystem II protein T [Urochondra setulosa]